VTTFATTLCGIMLRSSNAQKREGRQYIGLHE